MTQNGIPIENILTIFSPVGEKIDSQFGRITYRDWCQKEAARLNSGKIPRGVYVVEANGQCAIVMP